jgi:hypothetical protein
MTHTRRDVVLIEDVDDTGTQWFLSFDGPNPTEDQCVRCVDQVEAVKLKGLVDAMVQGAGGVA